MIWLALLLAQTAPPDNVAVARGAVIFSKTCAVAYCHGPEGSPGRAPQLAGRVFEREQLLRVVRDGMPNTSMPGFKDQLKPPDLEAVVAYVTSLAAAAAPPPPPPKPVSAKPAARPLEVRRGRELFFDPARLANCGACHLLDGWGVAIGPDVAAAAPKDLAALRTISSKRPKTAHPAGEQPFPALLVSQTKEQVQVYDLTVSPPVLRFFLPAEVRLNDGSAWSHAAAIQGYSDPELEAILLYLRWLETR